jgi:hypothetical protein
VRPRMAWPARRRLRALGWVRGIGARLATDRGESSAVSHGGWLVVALLLVVAFVVFALGPGGPWLAGVTHGITHIQPPPIPTT